MRTLNEVMNSNKKTIKHVSINMFNRVKPTFVKYNPLQFSNSDRKYGDHCHIETIRKNDSEKTRIVYINNDSRRKCTWVLVSPFIQGADKESLESLYADDKICNLYKLPWMCKEMVRDTHDIYHNLIMKKLKIESSRY